MCMFDSIHSVKRRIFRYFQLHGLSVFDLNNPLKPTPIPTKSGRWHKADTAFENKHIRVESSVHPIPRVQSAAAIRKFGLFYPGMEHKIVFCR